MHGLGGSTNELRQSMGEMKQRLRHERQWNGKTDDFSWKTPPD